MSNENTADRSSEESPVEADWATTVEQSVRGDREFSLAEVIGREAGDFLKGESPIPPLDQAKHEIEVFIEHYLADPEDCLRLILYNWIDDEARLNRHISQPLEVLREQLNEILNHPHLLYELVRQVDVKWGQINQERPHFQRPGQKPDSEDVYSHESVGEALRQLLNQVNDRLSP